MKTVHAAAFLTSLALAGCVSPPKPLQGQFSALTPEQAVQREGAGEIVRWGGRIVLVEPGSQSSCFEVVAAPLGSTGRPQVVDRSLGRFIACRAGFYDPEVFMEGREVTISGRVEAFETRKVGNYDYRYPRVAAEVIYLWPERRDVDVMMVDPFYRGYYGGRGWGWGMGWGRRW
jgi:outer membrane lipoprotein